MKEKLILAYELKRAALLNKPNNSSPHNQSTSRNKDGSTNITKPRVMSEKHETPRGSEPLFRGPSTSTKPTEAELRQIKVDIHRNIPGPVNPNIELHREIVNPENVIVKRRDGEGIRPIFDAIELKTPDNSSFSTEEECEEIKTISLKKSSLRDRSDLEDRRRDEFSRSRRRERSVHNQRRRSQRRSQSSDSSDNDGYERNRRNGRSGRSNDRSRQSSSHHHDRSSYSSRRQSSRERSRSGDRRRDELSRQRRSESARDYRGRSRERRDNYRQSERENSERRSREITSYPHYVEHIPVPVYYGDFPRPMMMGPMMPPMRGPPPVRNRPPFGARFPPRFSPRFPPRPRFNHQF